MTTTTADKFIQQVLNEANLNLLATAFRKMKIGNTMAPVKVTFTGLTAAPAIDITTLASKNAASIVGLDRETSDLLPPIQCVKTLRVTASGTASTVGSYGVSDAGGTAVTAATSSVMGVALLSDDGKTLTFPTTITAFVLEYVPRSAVDLATTKWPVGV